MSEKIILALFDNKDEHGRALTLFKLLGMRVQERFFDVADDSIRAGVPIRQPGVKRKYGIVCDEEDYKQYKKIYEKCKERYEYTNNYRGGYYERDDGYSKALWNELYDSTSGTKG